MRWIRAAGGLAVLFVIGIALGGVASLAAVAAIPGLATIVLIVLAFLIAILAAGPAEDWRSNPYW
jgi:hypothetical protein